MVIPESRWQYIPTDAGQYSTRSGGKNRLAISGLPMALQALDSLCLPPVISWVFQAWDRDGGCDNIRQGLSRKSIKYALCVRSGAEVSEYINCQERETA